MKRDNYADLRAGALGKVKECHNPRNEDCPNNSDAALDCACKRVRRRNPFKRVLVHDENMDRGYRADVVLEIWPRGGTIALREKGRRKRYTVKTSDVFAWAVRRAALAAMGAKKKKRRS